MTAETKRVSSKWYHQTSKDNAKSILRDGFYIESGGNQRFTEGVYFLHHGEGSYGGVTLECDIDGNFIDMDDKKYGERWMDFKGKYEWNNYTDLTEKIKSDYPNADGILFNSILVVWKPERICNCKTIRE